MPESDWRCRDCGVDTDTIDEYYMVAAPVWRQAAHDVDGHLCIGCLERRLGRTLRSGDFTDLPVNSTSQLRRSPRLASRLRREARNTL